MSLCDNCHQNTQNSHLEYISPNIQLCEMCYDKYLNYELAIDDEGNLLRISKYYSYMEEEPYWYDEDREY